MLPRNQTVVVGLGITGLACARFLASRGAAVAVTDSRAEPPNLAALGRAHPELPVSLGELDRDLLMGAAEIVLSPGVSLQEPAIAAAREAGVPVVSEIELFCRYAEAPIAAITGSNGKSTVTTLLGRMAVDAGLKAQVGGNLGRPALELLEDPAPDLYVLELSSFQLETTHSLRARAATVLNVSADHMDRYPDLAAYAAAKGVIYQGCGTAVTNRGDARAAALVPAASRRVVSFGLDAPPGDADYGVLSDGNGRPWLCRGERRLIAVEDLRVVGRHNHANALAALALGEAMGLDETAMLATLAVFPGLAHRTEWVARRRGVDYINDSKGTNVGATLAAIDGLPGPLVLIAGGQGKGADFSPLGPALAGKARMAIVFGEDAPLLTRALAGHVTVERAADLEEAVRLAAAAARPGDQVLMSPACASFDMFAGFEDRGGAFREAVGRLDDD
ncbi:UDP-N-acetylmuramoyl-L-alanine--D-glutamate ligase [Ectothiorhodospiraceae bacterium WFHF3C12]|nr:UDP-N-acetylmuramoyl-L-alanine--D-glutamate ligase [Ectothiorhodospiraceae bacterium WFHF3C12]